MAGNDNLIVTIDLLAVFRKRMGRCPGGLFQAFSGNEIKDSRKVLPPHEPECRAPSRRVANRDRNWPRRCSALPSEDGSGVQSANLGWEKSHPSPLPLGAGAMRAASRRKSGVGSPCSASPFANQRG